jgi:cysteine desulfurase / selenocysteine lyase
MFKDTDLASYREQFPHLQQPHYYLNHAAFGVLSQKTLKSINKHLVERSTGVIESFFVDINIIDATREKIAKLINAPSPDTISFITNTSEGLNVIASGFNWNAGDRILINDAEFPSNVYPFTNLGSRGVATDFLPSADGYITAEQIDLGLKPDHALISVSAVQFLSGYRIDLQKVGESARKNNSTLIVDAIQAIGNSTIDVQSMHIDGLVSGGLKWMMAPMGTGFMYISERLRDQIQQQYVGWLSVEEPWQLSNFDQKMHSTNKRYELGGINVPGIYAMYDSVDPFLELGTDAINSHLIGLTDLIHEELRPLNLSRFTVADPAYRSGIITYNLPTGLDGDGLIAALKQRNVSVSHRQGKVRFSPHFYNTSEDIIKALAIFREVYSSFK